MNLRARLTTLRLTTLRLTTLCLTCPPDGVNNRKQRTQAHTRNRVRNANHDQGNEVEEPDGSPDRSRSRNTAVTPTIDEPTNTWHILTMTKNPTTECLIDDSMQGELKCESHHNAQHLAACFSMTQWHPKKAATQPERSNAGNNRNKPGRMQSTIASVSPEKAADSKCLERSHWHAGKPLGRRTHCSSRTSSLTELLNLDVS